MEQKAYGTETTVLEVNFYEYQNIYSCLIKLYNIKQNQEYVNDIFLDSWVVLKQVTSKSVLKSWRGIIHQDFTGLTGPSSLMNNNQQKHTIKNLS